MPMSGMLTRCKRVAMRFSMPDIYKIFFSAILVVQGSAKHRAKAGTYDDQLERSDRLSTKAGGQEARTGVVGAIPGFGRYRCRNHLRPACSKAQ